VRLLRRFRDTMSNGQAVNCRVVETSSPTNGGDSGGPVVNDRGELVAVVSCCATKDRNISWFIEVSEVRTFLNAYVNRLQKQKGKA
jgi:S1-C subfamily serine protease